MEILELNKEDFLIFPIISHLNRISFQKMLDDIRLPLTFALPNQQLTKAAYKK